MTWRCRSSQPMLLQLNLSGAPLYSPPPPASMYVELGAR